MLDYQDTQSNFTTKKHQITLQMEKFLGNEFLKQDGTTATFDEVVKDADLIGLYFSAHWYHS